MVTDLFMPYFAGDNGNMHGNKDREKQEGASIEFQEEERKLVIASLQDRLKSFKEHREKNYEEDWDKWTRMVRGEYRYDAEYDDVSRNERWKHKVYYKIANQKRLSALAQIRDAKPNGDKLPLDLTLPVVKKTEEEQDIEDAIKQLKVEDDYMLDRHRRALDDHLTFSKSNDEFNKVMDDASKYGSGVFISPYVFQDYSFEYTLKTDGEVPALENKDGELTEKGQTDLDEWVKKNVHPSRKLKQEVRVGLKHVPIRNFFPDPACLGDGQKGQGHFVREYLSIKAIMTEVERGKFDKDVALALLVKYQDADTQYASEKPSSERENRRYDGRASTDVFKGIPVYTYYGDILGKDYKALVDSDSQEAEDALSDYETKSVKIMIAEDDGMLFAMENPYPTQQRSIHIVQWEEVEDEWVGRGIPEKIETLQQALNTLINVWLDQSEMVGAGMLGVNIKDLDEDETLEMYPNKIFYLKGDKPIRDILQQFNIQDASPALINSMAQILMLIDHESGVPKIIEGQGDVNAKTAYETQQQEAHALKQLGIVIDNFDKALAKAGEMLNEHIIIYNSDEHNFFGDYRVVARGYSTFEQKRVRIAELDEAIQHFLQNPTAQDILNGSAMLRERFRMMSPENLDFVYTDKEIEENVQKRFEQQKALMEQQQQIERDKIQAQIELEGAKGQARMQEKQLDLQGKAQIEDAKMEHASGENDKKFQLDKQKMAIDIEEKREDRNRADRKDLTQMEQNVGKSPQSGEKDK